MAYQPIGDALSARSTFSDIGKGPLGHFSSDNVR
jgi:hypothetical protein